MRTIFETCEPRDDVRGGVLSEDQFAADLHAVATGATYVPDIYKDPRTFFANTYPTRGLRNLVREVFGRFTGVPGASPCLRLETSFGGGKTHNLIALWHLAGNPSEAAAATKEWLDPEILPREPLRVVALTGDKYGAGEAERHGNVLTRTLWGEMAWQLDRYDVMQEADEQRHAPSQSRLAALLEGLKVLVLLDELPRYMRAAKGQPVGSGTLADQTLTFFHLLLTYASTHDNLVVVYTLSERDDAYGRERDEIVAQIAEARSVSARQERVMTPIGEDEIAPVLRQRLFRKVDLEAAHEVATAYAEHLRRIRGQGAPLPPDVEDPNFVDRIKTSYPFHPELLETLYRKTSSFPSFQRTRGALRLMAATIHNLWQAKESNPKYLSDAYLIQSTDIDLSHPAVREELTSRLDRPLLSTAIAEDIWSEHGNAHAQVLDRDWEAKGFPGVCRRIAQAVFLHSLVYHTAPGAAGAEPAEAHLACARPGLPFDVVDKVLDQIEEKFFYAEFDGRRYVFRDQPTITKLIESTMANLSLTAVKDGIRKKAQEIFDGFAFELIPFPVGPENVPDRSGKPLLVLLDFDHVEVDPGSDMVPRPVEEIFQYAGESRAFRNHLNNLVVVAVDRTKKEAMLEASRRAQAIEQLLASEPQRKRLSKESLHKLRQLADDAQLRYRVAITNAYSQIFYRSLHNGQIERFELPAQDSGDARRGAQEVIKSVLTDRGKVLTRDLAPNWVIERLWQEALSGDAELSLADLVDRFARRPRTYLLLDEGYAKLRQTVRRGVAEGVWVYVDHQTETVHRRDNPPAVEQVRFTSDALLLTPARAEKLYPVSPAASDTSRTFEERSEWATEGQEKGNNTTQGGDNQSIDLPFGWIEADGPATMAFIRLRDQLKDSGINTVRELELAIDGAENTQRLLDAWDAVTNAFYDATVVVKHKLTIDGGPEEGFEMLFRGPARQFGRLRTYIRSILVGTDATRCWAMTNLYVTFQSPCDVTDARFEELARDLEETYRCGPIGVKAR